ncbi:TIGR03767 family metallophosphoesterase [Gordonia alkaliphila]|uniref:TIGR03767 family metallophosphoesterase n=1 Tax=Gordonia alkaliphila TaxID=1053547 RepID=A0ABP8YUI8_9ACTN|nr:TIGR03767 family metallophosphoesterase [Gordonia alkaliphila]MCK0439462.1 TIGR03767 family metallophosphoesterase [Gordonia alkaliphila]
MSHSPDPRAHDGVSRRTFLAAGAAAAGAVAATSGAAGLVRAEPSALDSANAAGTTLDRVAVPGKARKGGYRKLTEGAGWPLYVRQELAAARSGRDSRRTALASFVQITDIHITDVQSPARFEYVHPIQGPAFRPQEALGAQGAVALIKRINQVASGPFTGRRFDCVVSTGDNTDNHELIELTWFQKLLSGGSVTPNTGARDRFEGVQALGSDLYWRPELASRDIYKDRGFVQIPGYLRAAMRTLQSPGLDAPWYAVFGNHDEQFLGTVPNGFLDWMYLSSVKFDLPGSDPAVSEIAGAMTSNPAALGPLLAQLRITGPAFDVTPDARRRPFTPREFVRSHFNPAIKGAGPVGHGFRDPDGPTWYSFQIAPGVRGIAMNTCNSLGISDGSMGEKQLRWIERKLREFSDELVLVFSHHTSTTMTATLPNPETPGEKQYLGEELVAVLKQHKNLIAWVNGHTHQNEMIAHRGATEKNSFWEINTASHIDFPQLARILEITDNGDGTLSIFTPLLEADSPYTADEDDLSPTGLASLYRELSFNDLHYDAERIGKAADRNCELLLAHPHR